jgi:hypothetical protein
MQFDFKQYAFGRQEKVSHAKLNSLLNVLEMNRTIYGPYSFEVYGTPTNSGFNILFTDDLTQVGGEYENGGEYYLWRDFQLTYMVQDASLWTELRFEDVKFQWDNTANGYVALVTGFNLTSPPTRSLGKKIDGNLNVNGVSTSNLKLFSTDYPNKFQWGPNGQGLKMVSSGGNIFYFFVQDNGTLRRHSAKPTSETDGTAV